MSAPASVHQETRRGAALIIERTYQPDPARCVSVLVKLLTYRAPDDVQEGGLESTVPKNEETVLLPEDGFDGIAPSANEEAFHE